jgi:hypothetical protein
LVEGMIVLREHSTLFWEIQEPGAAAMMSRR